MSAVYAPDPTREIRHLEAMSAQEFADWQTWLELGGFGSCDAYARTAAAFIIFVAKKGEVAFRDYTDSHVGEFLLLQPVKSRRIRKAHLNNWFSWGYRTDRIDRNPVDRLPTIKATPQPIIDVFTEAEQARLEGLPLPDGPLMTLLFETGLRKAEACNMRVERIDFAAGMVNVKEGAKRGKDRLVPIVPALAGAMDRLISEDGLSPEDYLWYDKPGGGFAIHVRRNKPIAGTSFGRWWYRCLDEADVPYVKRDPKRGVEGHGNPHTARHTFATRWRGRGLELDDLSQILGHASVAITSDLYVHTSTKDIGTRMRQLLEVEV